jgi:pectate lyase-like protein
MRGWYDVSEYGAKGDGTTPDHAAIQAAVDAASTHGGGVVWLPPGTYRLRAGIRVTRQVQLVGAGWPTSWLPGQPNAGTWFLVDTPGFAAITLAAPGSVLRDVAFVYGQPQPGPGWEPGNFPPAIHVLVSDVFIQSVHLFNPTNGIWVNNPKGVVGRVTLDRIWGQPLVEGIRINNARDVVKANNVHLWPFWSDVLVKEEAEVVRSFQYRTSIGIRCGRVDNPQFSNVFVFGYNRGFHFESSTVPSQEGSTSKFLISNADFDYCTVGVEVSGEQTTGMLVNVNMQGNEIGTTGLLVSSPAARVQGTNLRFTRFTTNAVRVAGQSAAHLGNIWATDWNLTQTQARFPAIEAADRGSVQLGRPLYFEQSAGVRTGPPTGGTGTIISDA